MEPNLARRILNSIYLESQQSDLLTGIELVRRKVWDKKTYLSYAENCAEFNPVDFLINNLGDLETQLRRGLPIDWAIFPDQFKSAALATQFDLAQVSRGSARFPSFYDFEKALYEHCLVKNHTPGADDLMTFAIFFDGLPENGHQGWHYGYVVALDEHITKDKDAGLSDYALNLQFDLPTWSKDKFPDEQAVFQNLKEQFEKSNYQRSPILEAKSILAADFVRYHLVAEKVRQEKKRVLPVYPLNFLDK